MDGVQGRAGRKDRGTGPLPLELLEVAAARVLRAPARGQFRCWRGHSLARQLPVGALDGLLVGVTRHAQDLVKVALCAAQQRPATCRAPRPQTKPLLLPLPNGAATTAAAAVASQRRSHR